MERSTAQGLVAEYLKYGEILHRITELSYEIDDVETQNGVRRARPPMPSATYMRGSFNL